MGNRLIALITSSGSGLRSWLCEIVLNVRVYTTVIYLQFGSVIFLVGAVRQLN